MTQAGMFGDLGPYAPFIIGGVALLAIVAMTADKAEGARRNVRR
jgi:hypothetical protein